ncbi:hypothetical protein [Allokutzneria sp. NRRL B-24872]|uniref:hypothetical protein n=1 Tax=Allokutzneria sp. NRRL B-24872 TaxID=1137961 RepID=UPI001177F265|nr:hypothetical protein [Allokutzneria sp. NRRL B-24872]
MTLNMVATPGKQASAAMLMVGDHCPTLALYLDPVNLRLQVPPFPGGSQVLARFCREVAREATKLADHLDRGRHALHQRPGRG